MKRPALAGLALAAIASCTGRPPPDATNDQHAYLGDTWDSRDIHVCWRNADASNAAYRDRVKRLIEREYNGRAGLHVYGFGDQCGWAGSTEIRVRVINETDTTKSEWRSWSYVGPHWAMGDTMTLNMADGRDLTIIHEFGHAIGFEHEQDRDHGLCQREPHRGRGEQAVGPYDARSVMDYCSNASTLSELDLLGLQLMYGAPGIFERRGDGAVRRHQDGAFCTVTSEEQLAAFESLRHDGMIDWADRLGGAFVPGVIDLGPCNWPAGFYKHASDPRVWFTPNDSDGFCHVQNPTQMETFGGFDLVRTIPDGADLDGYRGPKQGECRWGDGFYRIDGEAAIHRFSDGYRRCVVRDADQHRGQYASVEPLTVPASDAGGLFAGRTDDGLCAWQSGWYRHASDPTVYWRLPWGVCRLQSEAHANAWGQRPVWSVADGPLGAPGSFAEGLADLGICSWPDGRYEVGADRGVYKLESGTICYYEFNQLALVTPPIISVPAGSALGTMRTNQGFCAPDQRCLRRSDAEACGDRICGEVLDVCGYRHTCGPNCCDVLDLPRVCCAKPWLPVCSQ